MPSYASAFASEQITVSTTAVELDDDKFLARLTEDAATRVAAKEALITVENGAIRFTVDGTVPVDATNVGHVIANGGSFTLYGLTNISQFSAVRSGGADAIVNVTYFRS